jgi:hypothetical protein
MLTTHLHPVPRLRIVQLYLHSPINLHGVVLEVLDPGINLPLSIREEKITGSCTKLHNEDVTTIVFIKGYSGYYIKENQIGGSGSTHQNDKCV